MPSWKKVIISGSRAELSSVFAPSITGSLQGTASFAVSASQAVTASYITGSSVFGPYGANSVITSSYAATASYAATSSFSLASTANQIIAINKSGFTITKGTVVHLTGSTNSSDTPYITTASYESDNLSANTLGIAAETITFNSTGYVTTEGVLTGLNVTGFIAGQLVYLGANGAIIGAAPQAPLHSVRLGQVVRDSPTNNGSIYVRIDNGYEIGELHDVIDSTTTASFGDLLVKSGSVWTTGKQLTGSYGLTGSLTVTGSTTTDLVRITQTGTGNALKVEDSTNPDNTPFIIDNVGNVMIGTTSSKGTVTIAANGADGLVLDIDTANNTQSSRLFFKNSGSLADFSIRNTGQLLVIAAEASASVSSGTGRMYISASGDVSIGTGYDPSATRGAALQVSGSINIEEGFAYKQDGNDILYITRGAAGTSYDSIIGGVSALSGALSPDQTTAYGYYALARSNGTANTAIGYNAGENNTGSNQTLVGWNAGSDANGGSQTAVGRNAGYGNNGTFQSAYGYQAGYQNVGTNQTAIGSGAGYQNTASNQTAIGESAGYRNSGSNQTVVGANAGDRNTATQQTAVGLQAGYFNVGVAQTALGQQAGQSNSGSNQTAVGYAAGFQNSGSLQTAVGANAGRDNKGANQTATGYEAGRLNTADNQSAFGYEAGYLNTGSNQTAMGLQAGIYNSGSNQVAMGNSAGEGNRGNNQTAVGSQAGYLNTGSNQTAVGTSAGYQNSGSDNTNIGYQAGTYTAGVIINSQSAQSVFLGSQTTAGSGNRTNQIVIGYGAAGIGSNSVVLGNSSIATTALRGNVGINTTTPTYTLQIHAAPTASIRLQETGSGGNKRLDLTIDASGVARISANQSAQQMAFDTVNAERIRITKDGDVGIGTTTPIGKLTVSGSGGYLSYNDTNTAGNLLVLSGSSDELVRIDVSALSASVNTAVSYGIRGVNDTAFATYGKVTDGFMYASNYVNGLNIINYGEGTKEDYIRFYAGTNATATPNIHIQGSGSNKGFIGINKIDPIAQLDVNGNTIISGSLTTTSSVAFKAYTSPTSFPGTAAGYLAFDSAGNILTTAGVAAAATPGGNDTEIQYNNAGALAGTSAITFDGTTLRATGSFTGSLIGILTGTASFATTASFAVSASRAVTASFAVTASYFNATIQTLGTSIYSTNPSTTGFNTTNGIYIGDSAGANSTNSTYSNFIGWYAGYIATNANESNFIGIAAGVGATDAKYSNFIGGYAGNTAPNASGSNFIGYESGYGASNAAFSNFFGRQSGLGASNAAFSNLFGYKVASDVTGTVGIGPNNIIIGTNITLPVNASDSINIGGIIFGTGSYSNLATDPYSGSVANGRIGIGTTSPNATLDVNGSTIITGSLTVGDGTNTNLDPYGFIFGSGSYLNGSNSNSAILGGTFNKIHTSANQGIGNVILGGNLNMITGSNGGFGLGHQYSAIIGGELNSIDSSYPGSGEMIAASYSSSIRDSFSSAIIASNGSNIFFDLQTPELVAIIAAYRSEIASTQNAAIIGGYENKLEKLTYNSVILGGERNRITEPAENSVIIGGVNITGSQSNTVYMPNAHVTGSVTVEGGGNITGSLNITGSADITGHVKITPITTGSSAGNLAIQSDGKIIKAGGNAIVENYYYSVSNSVDTTFYEDDKVRMKWDETGNDLKFTMLVAPGGSGDMRSLGVLMGSTSTFNVAITTINVEYDLYSAGISAGNRMEAFVTAENDVTYPAYHVTAYNTGESYHNTIWIQKIIKI